MNEELILYIYSHNLVNDAHSMIETLDFLCNYEDSENYDRLANLDYGCADKIVRLKYAELAADFHPQDAAMAYRAIQQRCIVSDQHDVKFDISCSKYLPICFSQKYGNPEYRQKITELINSRREKDDKDYRDAVNTVLSKQADVNLKGEIIKLWEKKDYYTSLRESLAKTEAQTRDALCSLGFMQFRRKKELEAALAKCLQDQKMVAQRRSGMDEYGSAALFIGKQ